MEGKEKTKRRKKLDEKYDMYCLFWDNVLIRTDDTLGNYWLNWIKVNRSKK